MGSNGNEMGTNFGDSRGRGKFNVREWEAISSVYRTIIGGPVPQADLSGQPDTLFLKVCFAPILLKNSSVEAGEEC
jgi:hypothetical protein